MNLPPMLATAIAAALELVANEAINFDAATRRNLEKLDGKWLTIEVTPLGISFDLCLGYPIRIGTDCEAESSLCITGTPGAFLRFLQGNQHPKDMSISGDLALAQQLSALAATLDIDWEARLAEVMGDVSAHTLGQGIRRAGQWLSYVRSNFFADAEEYIHHEARSLPAREEAAFWADEVEQARMALDRLAARVKRLENFIPDTIEDDPL